MERSNRILSQIFKSTYTFRADYIRVLLISKVIKLLIVFPAITLLFRLTLDILNIQVVTEQNIVFLIKHPLVIFLLLMIVLFFSFLFFFEMGLYILISYYQLKQIPYNLTKLWLLLNRKVIFFTSLQLLLLLIIFLFSFPLFSSYLPIIHLQIIEIPMTILEELLSTTGGKLIYYSILVALLSISLRFLFAFPIYVVNQRVSFLGGIKESLRIPHKRAIGTIFMLFLILVLFVICIAITLFVLFVSLIVMNKYLPQYSHLTAAVILTAAQCILIMLFGVLQVLFSQALVFITCRHTALKPATHLYKSHIKMKRWFNVLIIYTVFLWSCINYLGLARIILEPDTKIIGHRGFIGKGVENTISSLQEAAKAGADMVEIDIQQTKDGEFVVFHDKNLLRLAGSKEYIYNMTLAELMNITVKSGKVQDKITSFDKLLEESEKLNINLLIDLKLHGHETSDYIEKIVKKIEAYNGLDKHYIQSRDYALAVKLKEYESRLRIGYVHAVSIGIVPTLKLDFISIEQSLATSQLIEQAKAQDLEFFVWTVNSVDNMKEYFVQNVDGVITSNPEMAKVIRTEHEEEKHFLENVWDKLNHIF